MGESSLLQAMLLQFSPTLAGISLDSPCAMAGAGKEEADELAALFARVNLLQTAEDIAEKQGLDIRAAIAAAESQAAASGKLWQVLCFSSSVASSHQVCSVQAYRLSRGPQRAAQVTGAAVCRALPRQAPQPRPLI